MQPDVDFNLYLITDRKACRERTLTEVVAGALKGGVKAVQLREKDMSSRELFELARELRELTGSFGARLLINDRVDIALAVKADGVHLGEQGLPVGRVRELLGRDSLISVSCHGPASAFAAREAGADFITYGPVYHTPSKAKYGPPVGIDSLKDLAPRVGIPVFALGGINLANAREAIAAGVHGIALISAIIAAQDPETETRKLLAILSQG
ncbi:MAG TPA: thiamine phosphate synthase [Geobacteraceae bacterium]|nr:thiamine phosphate synthase [Geobacteraceae bacterium]